ncbi:MAG: hypothetical protein L0Z62_44940 [Gemmataceae bacterium]|nr:hypothetical protein [Gemmataceae bacterium]
MSEQVERSRPELSAWQAVNLRLTAFPAEVASPQELAKWPGWEATFGSPPPNSASKERGQEIREEGAFEGNWLSLTRNPARLDWRLKATLAPDPTWRLKATLAPDPTMEELPSVGAFVDALPPFQEAMLRWLAVAPPLNRLAFGAVLALPVTEREAGYQTFSALLPFQLDPVTSRDFMYQINRPRASTTPGVEQLEINRLSKWLVARFTFVKVNFTGAQVRAHRAEDKGYQCRLELDINTPAERQEALPNAVYPGLFRELVGMACEIAKEGDVP